MKIEDVGVIVAAEAIYSATVWLWVLFHQSAGASCTRPPTNLGCLLLGFCARTGVTKLEGPRLDISSERRSQQAASVTELCSIAPLRPGNIQPNPTHSKSRISTALPSVTQPPGESDSKPPGHWGEPHVARRCEGPQIRRMCQTRKRPRSLRGVRRFLQRKHQPVDHDREEPIGKNRLSERLRGEFACGAQDTHT